MKTSGVRVMNYLLIKNDKGSTISFRSLSTVQRWFEKAINSDAKVLSGIKKFDRDAVI